MSFKTPSEILSDANHSGLRRALIVTALPLEMSAVRAHLAKIGSAQGRDGTIYECGQFSGAGDDWFVVVAQCGAGNQTAQSVVTYAHFDFQDFEVLIFIGVGGSRKTEAPIGCVIVSNRIYSPYSGKYGEDGFSARPRTLEVDNRLVQVAYKVERDGEWQGRIRAPLKGVLPPANDYPQPFPPGACIASIVSVEAVSAALESDLEHQIARFCGDAYAVEMEGYGTVFAADRERTPCIIIRGVSDMASNKTSEGDKIRQPVAAIHAAAFGFELLSLWGQVNRPMPRSPNPAINNFETKPTPLTNNVAPTTPTSRLVLNFEGNPEDFPKEKIDAIVQVLRQVTGNNNIKAVGSEPGSFRLLVEAQPEDRSKIDSEAVKKMLESEYEVDLASVLEEKDYRQVQALQKSLGQASQELLAWPRDLPDGTWIDRPELAQLLDILENQKCSTTVLLGPPGSGKSALLATLGAEMVKRGWPVLGIKADLLDSQVQNESDLQNRLGLPETPSIVLEQISKLQPVLLVIDQLDALAGYVDLRTGRLNVLLNLVRRLGKHPDIHIVLSARTFEFEHDVRLRSIAAESVRLELPAWHTILGLLETKGIQPGGWPQDAQEVLRSPQALSTFLRLSNREHQEPFQTYQTMLDQLWSDRILQLPDGSRLAQVASEIAETMAENESLWLAAARFDNKTNEVRSLISSGILATFGSDGSIGFSHQTLFDHALARGFARDKGRLSSYILSREASLFIRPKLWAALTYLRGVEPTTYQAELQTIWDAPNLRRHLRLLLIDFMGHQIAPSDYEALLLTPILKQGAERQIGFRAITGSPGWFERLRKTLLPEAMIEDENSSRVAVSMLIAAWTFAPAQVETLVRERWITNPAFDSQHWAVIESCLNWNAEVANLAVTLLARSNISTFRIDNLVRIVGVNQPHLALRLVRAKLDYELKAVRAEAQRRKDSSTKPKQDNLDEQIVWNIKRSPVTPFTQLLENESDWDGLAALAEIAPAAFLTALWPWFQNIFAAIREIDSPNESSVSFSIPYHADFRFESEDHLGLSEPSLLAGLRVAVERLASSEMDAFLEWIDTSGSEDAMPVQRLIAHALSSQPEQYAKRALKFLLDDIRRFNLGNIHDSSGTTVRLIRAVAPFWTDIDFARFEKAVLDYEPSQRHSLKDVKARQHFKKFVRWNRLDLLRALPDNRISPAVSRLIIEETRVFPDDKIGAKFSGVRSIGSPMEALAISKASDEDVINAFKILPDATGWNNPRDWMVGGNIQLSRAFADFAKSNSSRAISLISQFEPSFGERAAGYAFDAMAESVDGQVVVKLFVDLARRGFSGEEFRGSASRGIERLVKRNISIDDEVVEILSAWLEHPSLPDEAEQASVITNEHVTEVASPEAIAAKDGDEGIHSVLWGMQGITILPSGNFPVLEAIFRILIARPDQDRLAIIIQAHLLRSENPNVWQAFLQYFNYLRPSREAQKAELLNALFAKYPELTQTREAVHLLAHAHWWAPDLVRNVIDNWTQSDKQWLRQAYGELVALIAIVQPNLEWAVESLNRILTSPVNVDARVGAAFSAANLWNVPGRRNASAQLLSAVIPLADKRVWTAVLDVFRIVDELTPDEATVDFLRILSDHINSAGRISSTFVADRLETLLPHEALIVAKIALGLVSNWSADLGNFSAAASLAAPQLVDLAITLHRLGPDTREAGTSLFEELLVIDAYTARQTLDEIDNRFTAQSRPTRARLPRRSGRRSLVTP